MARELDNEINDSLDTAITDISRLPARDLFPQINPRGDSDDHGPEPPADRDVSSDVFFFLITEDATVANNPRNINAESFPLASLQRTPDQGQLWDDLNVEGTHYRVTAVPAETTDGESFPGRWTLA
jgi:hypothetical protein